jgi:hypothetical protein
VSHFDRQELYEELTARGRGEWARELQQKTEEALSSERHGKLAEWIQALESLPSVENVRLNAANDAVTIEGTLPEASKAAIWRHLCVRYTRGEKGRSSFLACPSIPNGDRA